MPMGMRDGRRVVELETLTGWWRDRMTADPVHQQRLRARTKETEMQSTKPSEPQEEA